MPRGMTIERLADGWSATIPGSPHPAIVQVAPLHGRPFLNPLRSPSGRLLTEDRATHHPWQHGLYCGLNGIDGAGFWTEGLHPDPHRQATDGRIRCSGSGPVDGGWEVRSDWCRAGGEVLLRDRLELRPACDEQGWWCDIDWRITAVGSRHFEAYDYGGLFLRMPVHDGTACDLRTDRGALLQPAADGGRFAWVALAISENGPPAGLAIIDHAGNEGHPVPWRIDGQHGIGPSPCRLGARTLADGACDRRRYRVIAFDGPPDAARIASLVPGVQS